MVEQLKAQAISFIQHINLTVNKLNIHFQVIFTMLSKLSKLKLKNKISLTYVSRLYLQC
jgi:hypothetical protein